jgi:hypothetical protein
LIRFDGWFAGNRKFANFFRDIGPTVGDTGIEPEIIPINTCSIVDKRPGGKTGENGADNRYQEKFHDLNLYG